MNTELSIHPKPTLAQMQETAQALAKTSLAPAAYKNKPDDLLVAVMFGDSVGLSPAQAMQSVNVIQGRPSFSSECVVALCRSSPHFQDLYESITDDGTDEAEAVAIAYRKGCSPVTARFSVDDAKRAGLWGRGAWRNYPFHMLKVRARTTALKTLFADVLAGVASPVVPEAAVNTGPEIVITIEATTFEKAKDAIADIGSMEALDVTANVIEQRVLEGRLTAAEATELMHIIAQRSEQLAQRTAPNE